MHPHLKDARISEGVQADEETSNPDPAVSIPPPPIRPVPRQPPPSPMPSRKKERVSRLVLERFNGQGDFRVEARRAHQTFVDFLEMDKGTQNSEMKIQCYEALREFLTKITNWIPLPLDFNVTWLIIHQQHIYPDPTEELFFRQGPFQRLPCNEVALSLAFEKIVTKMTLGDSNKRDDINRFLHECSLAVQTVMLAEVGIEEFVEAEDGRIEINTVASLIIKRKFTNNESVTKEKFDRQHQPDSSRSEVRLPEHPPINSPKELETLNLTDFELPKIREISSQEFLHYIDEYLRIYPDRASETFKNIDKLAEIYVPDLRENRFSSNRPHHEAEPGKPLSDERIIRTREAASILNIPQQNLKKLAQKGKIGALINNQYVFSEIELDYYSKNPPRRGQDWTSPFQKS